MGTKRRGPMVSKQQCEDIALKACAIRDQAVAAYREAKEDPDLQADDFDPGDAEVTLEGNGHNVLRVLNMLALLGVPGCETDKL